MVVNAGVKREAMTGDQINGHNQKSTGMTWVACNQGQNLAELQSQSQVLTHPERPLRFCD
jgi:hypothetical protein